MMLYIRSIIFNRINLNVPFYTGLLVNESDVRYNWYLKYALCKQVHV